MSNACDSQVVFRVQRRVDPARGRHRMRALPGAPSETIAIVLPSASAAASAARWPARPAPMMRTSWEGINPILFIGARKPPRRPLRPPGRSASAGSYPLVDPPASPRETPARQVLVYERERAARKPRLASSSLPQAAEQIGPRSSATGGSCSSPSIASISSRVRRQHRPAMCGDRAPNVQRHHGGRRDRQQTLVHRGGRSGANRCRPCSAASAWMAAIAAWSWYGPGTRRRRAAPDRARAGPRRSRRDPSDRDPGRPGGRSTNGGGPVRVARRESWRSISARSPSTSASSGISAARKPAHGGARLGERRSQQTVAGGRGIALVEHEIDDRQHGPQPVGQRRVGRAPRRRWAAARILRLARTSRWAIVRRETRNARAISAAVRPLTAWSVSATRASGVERRMAAGEDEAEALVADLEQAVLFVQRGLRLGHGSSCSLASPVRRRRSPSIARLRATVSSHAAGASGSP